MLCLQPAVINRHNTPGAAVLGIPEDKIGYVQYALVSIHLQDLPGLDMWQTLTRRGSIHKETAFPATHWQNSRPRASLNGVLHYGLLWIDRRDATATEALCNLKKCFVFLQDTIYYMDLHKADRSAAIESAWLRTYPVRMPFAQGLLFQVPEGLKKIFAVGANEREFSLFSRLVLADHPQSAEKIFDLLGR